jgi:hypothetical protein
MGKVANVSKDATTRALRLVGAAVICAALAVQAHDDLTHGTFTWAQLPGYFTPLANLAGIAALIAAAVSASGPAEPRWLSLLRVNSATHLVIVAVVYWTLLAPYARPLHPWANATLHGGAAVLLTLDWLLARPRPRLPWSSLWSVLALPAAWLSYLGIRAIADGWMPYPFLDASHGLALPAMSIGAMVAAGLTVATALHLAARARAARV